MIFQETDQVCRLHFIAQRYMLMNIAVRGGGCGDCLGLMLYSTFATPFRDSICPICS